jgi:hypothetical protein
MYRKTCLAAACLSTFAIGAPALAQARGGHSVRRITRPTATWGHRPTPTKTTPTTTTTTTPTTTTPTTTTPSAPSSTPTSSDPQPVGIAGNWKLAFDDEFNGTSLNTGVWTTHDGWTNQNNVTDEASNVSVAGGYAALKLASSGSGAAIATISAGLSVGEVAEARIEFAGAGTTIYNWPAFWASGANWPAAGENDIAEGLGTLTVNYHSPSGTHNQGTVPGDWAGSFHTYAIERLAHESEVFWDGKLVKSYATDDNGQPESLIFTVGSGNTLMTGVQGEMLVDYARIWAPA